MAECVLKRWDEAKITPITYLFDNSTGKMVRHKTQGKNRLLPTTTNIFRLVLLLYVDDGGLCFNSYKEMTEGVSIMEKEMRRFGLVMHTGTRTSPSKTEYMFFPSITRTQQIIKKSIEEKEKEQSQQRKRQKR